MTDDKIPDLKALQTELAAAMEQHESARLQESAARSAMCEATNRLNRAQKALDDAMEKLRAKAPWSTDWHSRLNPPREVS